MSLSKLNKLSVLAVIAVLMIGTATAQAQPDRSAWIYARGAGSFSMAHSPGQWVEQTHLGTVYTFTEIARTREYVELFDRSRALYILLYDDACYIRHSGTFGRYELLYRGYWGR